MKIATVVPAYLPSAQHWQALVNRCLGSIVTQTRLPDNLVVVLNGIKSWSDKCPLDKVKESIEAYVRTQAPQISLTILQEPEKIGAAAARNLGFKEIENCTDCVSWLDADDRWHPEKLNIQEQFMFQYPGVDIVGTSYYDVNTAMDGLTVPGNNPSEVDTYEKIVEKLKKVNVIPLSSTIIKNKTFNRLEGFAKDHIPGTIWPEYGTEMWEDWDLFNRAAKNGFDIAMLPHRLYFWHHDLGVSRDF